MLIPSTAALTNPNRIAELVAAERAPANGLDGEADLAKFDRRIADAQRRIDDLLADPDLGLDKAKARY